MQENKNFKAELRKKFTEIQDDEYGIVDVLVEDLMDHVGRNLPQILPYVHELYANESFEYTGFLAWEVLKHIPDEASIKLLIANDEDISRSDLEEYSGYLDYVASYGDPFSSAEVASLRASTDPKLLFSSDLPTENIEEETVNKEVLSTGFIRAQYPKSVWRNLKDRVLDSFQGSDGRVFKGARMLWPAEMTDQEIKKAIETIESSVRSRLTPGVMKVGWDKWTIVLLVSNDLKILKVSPWWEKY